MLEQASDNMEPTCFEIGLSHDGMVTVTSNKGRTQVNHPSCHGDMIVDVVRTFVFAHSQQVGLGKERLTGTGKVVGAPLRTLAAAALK